MPDGFTICGDEFTKQLDMGVLFNLGGPKLGHPCDGACRQSVPQHKTAPTAGHGRAAKEFMHAARVHPAALYPSTACCLNESLRWRQLSPEPPPFVQSRALSLSACNHTVHSRRMAPVQGQTVAPA